MPFLVIRNEILQLLEFLSLLLKLSLNAQCLGLCGTGVTCLDERVEPLELILTEVSIYEILLSAANIKRIAERLCVFLCTLGYEHLNLFVRSQSLLFKQLVSFSMTCCCSFGGIRLSCFPLGCSLIVFRRDRTLSF